METYLEFIFFACNVLVNRDYCYFDSYKKLSSRNIYLYRLLTRPLISFISNKVGTVGYAKSYLSLFQIFLD